MRNATERMGRPLAHELNLDLADVRRKLTVLPDNRIRWNGREIAPGTPWTTEYPWFELWDENQKLVRRFWPFVAEQVVQDREPVAALGAVAARL